MGGTAPPAGVLGYQGSVLDPQIQPLYLVPLTLHSSDKITLDDDEQLSLKLVFCRGRPLPKTWSRLTYEDRHHAAEKAKK